MAQVYECRSSLEDERPEIDFELAENAQNDWLMVAEVLDGSRPVEEFPADVRIMVAHPEAIQWDCYSVAGARGLFSGRFVEAVGGGAFRGLSSIPAKLNDVTYYFLRCDQPVDCLDRKNAVFETFRSDPTAIKRITRYAFLEDRLPVDGCFCLPELPYLLLTESVVRRLNAANLKGLRLLPLP